MIENTIGGLLLDWVALDLGSVQGRKMIAVIFFRIVDVIDVALGHPHEIRTRACFTLAALSLSRLGLPKIQCPLHAVANIIVAT